MPKLTCKILITILILIGTTQFGVAQMDSTKTDSNNELAWMVGHWEGEAFGGTCEEDWQPMTAGTMCGTYKQINNGKVVFYELMIIRKTETGYDMNLKHFNADMTGWEEKDKVINFAFESVKENFIQFKGISYERTGDDKLQIVVHVGNKDGGSDKIVIDCVKE